MESFSRNSWRLIPVARLSDAKPSAVASCVTWLNSSRLSIQGWLLAPTIPMVKSNGMSCEKNRVNIFSGDSVSGSGFSASLAAAKSMAAVSVSPILTDSSDSYN